MPRGMVRLEKAKSTRVRDVCRQPQYTAVWPCLRPRRTASPLLTKIHRENCVDVTQSNPSELQVYHRISYCTRIAYGARALLDGSDSPQREAVVLEVGHVTICLNDHV